jgi:hypothetical protein
MTFGVLRRHLRRRGVSGPWSSCCRTLRRTAAAIFAFVASLDRLLTLRVPRLRGVIAHGIGSLAAAWFIQRLMAIV